METPTEPPRVSSNQSKKRSWPKKNPKKLQHQRFKNPSMEPSNITFSVTPNVNGEHSPRQPQPADEDIKGPEELTKVFPIISKNSSRRKKTQPSTASGVKVERNSAVTSEFEGSLSTKNYNPKHSNSSKERVKNKVMEDPEVFPTSFSATVELVDLFSNHSPQDLQASAPESLQKPVYSSKKNKMSSGANGGLGTGKGDGSTVVEHHHSKKPRSTGACEEDQILVVLPKESKQKQKEGKKSSPGLTGGVPLVGLPQIASVCHSPRMANVFDLDVLPSHQHSLAGASQNAQIPTPSPKGKQKLDEKSSDLATQALVLESRRTVLVKPYSPRKLALIDEDAEPVPGESSSSQQHSSAGALQNAQIPTPPPKGKQKLNQKSSDLATQALVFESRQIVPIKPYSPRKLALIDEDAEPVLGESSSSALQTLQRSTMRSKGQKRNKKMSYQPACQVQSLQNHPSPSGPAARAETAKNITQVFAAHQLLGTRNRSHKTVASRKKFPFLRLPRELRDIIIDFTIDYEGIDSMLVKINSTFPSISASSRKFNKKLQEWMTELDGVCFRSTPTILVLNKQIYEEAQEILHKKPLRISHPPQYPIKSIYDSSHVISDEALSKLSKIQFELQTYPGTERRHDIMQSDWKGENIYRDEFLENSYPWAMLLKDCFQVWRGTQEPRYLELSIDHCSGERSQFNLAVFGEKILAFENCIDAVLESHDLDALMDFLMFADAPIDFF